ncbi:MAG: S9 family peptidase [Saprospiraceae bacterium]
MRSLVIIVVLFLSSIVFGQISKRVLKPKDIYTLPAISDPQISPDKQWIAYTVSIIDTTKDKRQSDIWMVSIDGKINLQITHSPDAESSPKWSPDGKYLSFLSGRQDGKGNQLWLVDRRGGEGKRVTTYKGAISDYAWRPDGKKILITMTDVEPTDTTTAKTPKPMVMDRYQFKQDIEGYRHKKLYAHLYLLDINSKSTDTLTTGNFNHSAAVWSPDGTKIAFVSNRTNDPDKNENTDICVMEGNKGSNINKLTTWNGSDTNPQWSPDGKQIAYTRSTSSDDFIMYDQAILAVMSMDGGEPTLLSEKLDRPVSQPKWLLGNKEIATLVADDRRQYIASFDPKTGKMKNLSASDTVVQTLQCQYGIIAVIASTSDLPSEIFAFENGIFRQLTHQSDSLIAKVKLAKVKGVTAKAKDGNVVNGVLYLPAEAIANQPLPLLMIIHGGPVSQDNYAFNMQSQILAGAGYAVVNVNYRGSSGRGLAYSKSISGDWGNLEVVDLHAIVDELVRSGVADPNRLGVGGWSYGGILTDYLIATDHRFKAAVSGAGVAFPLALYGVDQYIMQYDNEIGVPWKNLEKYLKVSYPFLHADRIKTPTLFMVGEKDFNVPSAGSEQMYQALRSQDVPTQLIVYPGQFHGILVPSYQLHRYEKYLEWFDKYLK